MAGEERMRYESENARRARICLRVPVTLRPGDDENRLPALLTTRPESVDELRPQEGDLVPFTFRLLSAAYLGGSGYHLDFSRERVLPAAVPLFQEPEMAGSARSGPLVVVRDHSFDVEDRIGLVRNARWSPAMPEEGLTAPGIDAELQINWKLAEDVVRRLLHDPPLIDACSVSLGFSWEKSHPELEDWQFWMRLGEELEGSPVRVMVTEILSVEHVGLVYAGADASARQREGAKTSSEERTAREELEKEQSLPTATERAIRTLLGVEDQETGALEARVREVVAMAELGEQALADLRSEVRQLIIQLEGIEGDDTAQALLKIIESADMGTLKTLRVDLTRRLEALMPAQCQVCGSSQVSRRSSRDAFPVHNKREQENPGLYG